MTGSTMSCRSRRSWPSDMGDYAILTWRPDDQAARAPLQRAQAALRRLGLELAAVRPGFEAWRSSLTPPSLWLSPDEDGVVVGQVFGSIEDAWRADPLDCARALGCETWGRYVAIFREQAGPARAFFRDPSGGLEALAWRCGALTVVASDLDALLEAVPPHDLAVDWPLLGAALADRLALAGRCPLRGVAAATPGALRWLDGSGEVMAWSPGAFARETRPDSPEARRGLVEAVDRAVASLARPGAPLMAEVSGGLDSSIVASALAARPEIHVAQWLHYFVEDPAADERRYARATARHLDLALTEAPKSGAGLDLATLSRTAKAIRPSGANADAHYDRDIAERARTLGAAQLFTGLAGDTVFMSGGGALVAADAYWRRPFWSAGLAPSLSVARRVHGSVWSIWRQAQAARFGWTVRSEPSPPRHLAWRQTAPAVHGWLQDLDGVAPAKRRQVRHLALQVLVSGRTLRGQVLDLVHPLLAQPVMETCLALSVTALTHGGDDRAMAREAFRERLAPEVRARRSKGDLGRHYGRAIAEDLTALRELLLDGCLVEAGLLDPTALDELLTVETLIWKGPYREIIEAVVLEQWVRSWTRRLAGLGRRPSPERLVEEV